MPGCSSATRTSPRSSTASASDGPPLAVDIDSVAGLGSDDEAIEFVTGRLGIRVVLTRRPQVAAHVAERGHLGLVHVFAYDSTGMTQVAREPSAVRIGSAACCRRAS